MSGFRFATIAIAVVFAVLALQALSRGNVGAFVLFAALAALFSWHAYSMGRSVERRK